MQTLLAQVQSLQLANTPTKEETTASDEDADADAVPVGDVDMHDRQPHPARSINMNYPFRITTK